MVRLGSVKFILVSKLVSLTTVVGVIKQATGVPGTGIFPCRNTRLPGTSYILSGRGYGTESR